ncbi:MAG: enoyl-CoA hydratase/isomerase family protein [Chloroflexi bacterium]|nr:enoyl-CoA hydratase/isomerase family protein [Chloroflexota bacterium]
MDFEFIKYEKRDRIAYVTINRPDSLNALQPDASKEMRRAFEDFKADPNSWVAIITGTGEKAFCAGFDLKYAASRTDEDPAEAAPLGGITREWECWKPIIAAVNGFAMGGGMELALACDLIIASENAIFGLPEVRRGFPPGAGGPQRLMRQIGWKHAMGVLLTGRQVPASEARELGFVNEVVPQDELIGAAERWATQIIEAAPLAVRAAKQLAYEGVHLTYDESMTRRYSEYDRVRKSKDFKEGPRAFVEKRPPVWQGE